MGSVDAGLGRLVRNAILLRVVVAILIHFLIGEELFAPDQATYHVWSVRLARYWSGETLVLPARFLSPGPKGYYYVVAALYTVLGSFPLVAKLANALLGGLSVAVLHDVATRVTGSAAVAERAARYFAYLPSLVLWSALNIRDAWVIFLILLICREALVLQERVSPASLLLLGAAIVAVTQFRDYIFFAVTGPMLVSFLVRNRQHLLRNVLLGMMLASVVIYGDQAAGTNRRLRTPDLEELQNTRQWNAAGAGSGFEAADISTPGKALVFLPLGLAYFLFAPFPWMVTGVRQALALPEMLFFYALVPGMVRGLGVLVKERLSHALMILLITGGLTLGYALGEGNAGTAYRHRAQVISFYLIFAAVGIEARNQRRALALSRELAAAGQPA
jgi:hypothetical protein